MKTLVWRENVYIMEAIAAATPSGCFLELGVYQGGTAYPLWKIAKKQKRILHLYDTFAGIPEKSMIDKCEIGDFGDNVHLDELKQNMPDAVFHVGVFPDTLTDDVNNIAFAHIDCDQYISMTAAIEKLWPRIVPGGVMLFDDYEYLEGARAAIDTHFKTGLIYSGYNRVRAIK